MRFLDLDGGLQQSVSGLRPIIMKMLSVQVGLAQVFTNKSSPRENSTYFIFCPPGGPT